METTFFIAGIVALAATLRTITCAHSVHALLYLIVSLLAVAVDFYALGAPFAATLEVVVYAGAVMVLFVFVVMMLNLNQETVARERHWLRPKLWIGPGVFAAILLAAMIWAMTIGGAIGVIEGERLSAHAVGATLFGPYVLVTELAAFLLLAALVVAAHIGRDEGNEARRKAEHGDRATTTAGER
ncbi:NADH-quinone oxidoreductase subunit J [Salinisphaera sp.]|uniref:NADH-quinone oxidoreductase subunit J n=1 Tax=Salinisphaera sp. TaxID=1914330 RepID=UPI002D780E2D|nr:NADH-quinone oxidoreductase subunit J [Salinisphaera sp.]HET7314822.1 NADH-quinone oxidoreductase subunit J [Salinisphaera sp.]